MWKWYCYHPRIDTTMWKWCWWFKNWYSKVKVILLIVLWSKNWYSKVKVIHMVMCLLCLHSQLYLRASPFLWDKHVCGHFNPTIEIVTFQLRGAVIVQELVQQSCNVKVILWWPKNWYSNMKVILWWSKNWYSNVKVMLMVQELVQQSESDTVMTKNWYSNVKVILLWSSCYNVKVMLMVQELVQQSESETVMIKELVQQTESDTYGDGPLCLRSQLYLRASPFLWDKHVCDRFNPIIEIVTFQLHGAVIVQELVQQSCNVKVILWWSKNWYSNMKVILWWSKNWYNNVKVMLMVQELVQQSESDTVMIKELVQQTESDTYGDGPLCLRSQLYLRASPFFVR